MPQSLAIAVFACLLASAAGFRKTVWFISLGYTASILLLGLGTVARFHQQLDPWHWIQLLGLLAWAARLGFFLLRRERDEHYAQAVRSQTDASQAQPLGVKLAIWVGVSVLYACMFFPALLAAQVGAPAGSPGWRWAGGILLIAGVLLEALADHQKSAFKAKHPARCCDVRLYRWVRSPNYLGEILVWTGNAVMGISYFTSLWSALVALTGWVCIVLIMVGSAKRLERKQEERYGADADFRRYVQTVPVLFPWVPVYSLKKVRVFLE